MGYFDGMTGAVIRTGHDGARYYAPLGKYGRMYAVPDDAASARLQTRWRWFYYALFAIMLFAVYYTHANWRLIILAPVAGLIAVPFGYWAARGLPTATIAYSDLPAITRAQALTTYSRATGRRTLGFVLCASVLMTVMGLATALLTGQIMLWLSTGLFALTSVSIFGMFRRAK